MSAVVAIAGLLFLALVVLLQPSWPVMVVLVTAGVVVPAIVISRT